MTHIKIQLVPPGGWHFFDLGMRLTADSYEELYKKVLKFRLDNKAPIDTIQEDINKYIASISPQHVIKVTNPGKKVKGLADRIYDVTCELYTKWKPSRLRAPTPEMERRAEVCKGCPMNKKYRSGCPACATATKRLLTAMQQGRHSRLSGYLGGCEVFSFDIPAAITLEKDTLGEDNNPKAPAKCWRTKL
jgi:hypothetical protein